MAWLSRFLRRMGLKAVARWLGDRAITRHESEDANRDLRLLGFRKAAWGLLLRRRAQAAARLGGWTIVAPCLDGRFVFACAGEDSGVGWEILEHGTYEPHVVEIYRRTLRPGMTVLDVGGNIGFHALHAASLVGAGGRVIAIEPDPKNAGLIRLAASQNPGFRIELIEAALSDRDGDVVLSDLGNPSNSGARFVHEDRAVLDGLVHGPQPRFRSVPAFAWDARFLDTKIDFVKIDVEGFEPRVVRGMERSLARHRPIVLSELAPSNLASLGGSSAEEYLAWFRARGYACRILAEGSEGLVAATPESIAKQLRGRHHIDVLFEPQKAPARLADDSGEAGSVPPLYSGSQP